MELGKKPCILQNKHFCVGKIIHYFFLRDKFSPMSYFEFETSRKSAKLLSLKRQILIHLKCGGTSTRTNVVGSHVVINANENFNIKR